MPYVFKSSPGVLNISNIVNVDTIIPIPAGKYLLVIVVTPANNSNISVGTTPGGNELTIIPVACAAGQDQSIVINQNFSVATPLYITGIVSATTIKAIIL